MPPKNGHRQQPEQGQQLPPAPGSKQTNVTQICPTKLQDPPSPSHELPSITIRAAWQLSCHDNMMQIFLINSIWSWQLETKGKNLLILGKKKLFCLHQRKGER